MHACTFRSSKDNALGSHGPNTSVSTGQKSPQAVGSLIHGFSALCQQRRRETSPWGHQDSSTGLISLVNAEKGIDGVSTVQLRQTQRKPVKMCRSSQVGKDTCVVPMSISAAKSGTKPEAEESSLPLPVWLKGSPIY